tara:strand:+ start:1965 stop:2789 length:825 start_codon:yes stop_codon:yes gene_type:complete
MKVDLKKFCLSNKSEIKFILGPCQIESKDHAFEICSEIESLSKKIKFDYVFKSSFDKANRTSYLSKRGVGIKKGLDILSQIKDKFSIPVISDVHDVSQINFAKSILDIIQIPAFLCRQTDLLIEAGKTGIPVNVKKGQFLAPDDMRNIIKKILSTNNKKIILTERGTMFGYNNLITDIRSLPIMKKTGFPVFFDATHSVQLPGSNKKSSGGEVEYVGILAKACTTVGIAGLFMETHENPKKAPSDSACMIPLKKLGKLIQSIKLYDNLSKNELL